MRCQMVVLTITPSDVNSSSHAVRSGMTASADPSSEGGWEVATASTVLPGFLVLAALLVVAVGSWVPEGIA